MITSRIFYTCITTLLITACNNQQQSQSVQKATETKPLEVIAVPITDNSKVPAVPQKTRTLINFSIDDLSLGNKSDNINILINDNAAMEDNSELFTRLSQKKSEPGINVSGELLSDENADEETDYLKSVNGLQIEIQGSFD